MLDKQLLGVRIANARNAKGLTARQLAQKMGVQVTSVERWESGEMDPRANRLDQMAGILGVPLMWLIAGSDAPPEMDTPDLSETHKLEEVLDQAQDLVNQLSFLLVDLRAHVRRVQRDMENNDP